MQILRVIEAYCVSSMPKNRQTLANSGKKLFFGIEVGNTIYIPTFDIYK